MFIWADKRPMRALEVRRVAVLQTTRSSQPGLAVTAADLRVADLLGHSGDAGLEWTVADPDEAAQLVADLADAYAATSALVAHRAHGATFDRDDRATARVWPPGSWPRIDIVGRETGKR